MVICPGLPKNRHQKVDRKEHVRHGQFRRRFFNCSYSFPHNILLQKTIYYVMTIVNSGYVILKITTEYKSGAVGGIFNDF